VATTNLVGTAVPTDEDNRQVDISITTIRSYFQRYGATASPELRGSFLKPRIGAGKHMSLIAVLAREMGVNITGMPVDDMEKDIKVGDVAYDLEQKLSELNQKAADTRLIAYGEAWQSFLAYYGVLASMASRDHDLAVRLRPVVEFMSAYRTKKAKETNEANETNESIE
jgi:hypothetical protein